ncbi:hypothetical protein WDV93_20675 [Pantoea ananatis]
MITDITIRYASNISFKMKLPILIHSGVAGENISAVSWEIKNMKRSDGTLTIIKEMVKKLSTSADIETIYIYIQLSGKQPDTRLIRYKKTWGLLEVKGLQF